MPSMPIPKGESRKMDEGRVFFNLFRRKFFSLPHVSNEVFRETRSHDFMKGGGREREKRTGVFVLAGSSPRLAKFTARKAIDFNSREANSSLSPSLSLCLGGRDRWYNGEGKGVAKWP